MPSISEVISHRRGALFGHVARLQQNVPAHKILHCHVDLSLGRPPSDQWKRRPGRPRERWIDQVWKDNGIPRGTCGSKRRVVVTEEQRYGPRCPHDNDDDDDGPFIPACPTIELHASELWQSSVLEVAQLRLCVTSSVFTSSVQSFFFFFCSLFHRAHHDRDCCNHCSNLRR